jgi:hypothetical protein
MDADTAISIFFGAALAVFSVVLVGIAFVRGHQPGPAAGADIPPTGDDPALGDIFDAIRTLELEYGLGRMPQEEFQTQFQAYRVQAATVLRDQLEAGHGEPAWVLEQEILLARGAQESSSGRAAVCPNCSAAVPDGSPDCPHCGTEMALESRPGPGA